MGFSHLAHQALTHCRTIASFTDEPGAITRLFLGPATRRCHVYLADWMRRLGMLVALDAVGNLRGVYPGSGTAAKRLIIGSHLDTVPNAGAFDGVLGVVIGLALVESLGGERLPFAIEVIGFSEEEGVRFGIPFIGSRAVAGNLNETTLNTADATGVTIRQAISEFGLEPQELRRAALKPDACAYLEFHIEQGPVLENAQCPLGVVTAIVGQSRAFATFRGRAHHAGTTPMSARKDALCTAAEWVTGVEALARTIDGLVATVGHLEVKPGATNVIPGEVKATLDVRHAADAIRLRETSRLLAMADDIAHRRGICFEFAMRAEQNAVTMNETLTQMAERAIQSTGTIPLRVASGAGHDAMILASQLPSAMIFLRSPGGISHHPDETVFEKDVEAALRAGSQLLKDLCSCPFLT